MIYAIIFGPLAFVIAIALFVTKQPSSIPDENIRESTERARLDAQNYIHSNNNNP